MKIDRALIIADPWIDLILDGKKRLEMRSRHTNIRGRIGLIRKGSGLIVGDVWLSDSVLLSKPALLKDGHCIDYEDNPELEKYNVAWVLSEPRRYCPEIPYRHPQGAVTWVKVAGAV